MRTAGAPLTFCRFLASSDATLHNPMTAKPPSMKQYLNEADYDADAEDELRGHHGSFGQNHYSRGTVYMLTDSEVL